MKVAFDVDVLAKQMSIKDMVYKVADWGYKYIEQSPHPRINPYYKHPLFSKECEAEYRQALKDTGVEISSFIVVYRWSGPTEEQRQHAVANWKKIIEIAVNMGVPVINTEFSGDPNQQEICNGMWFRSMEELLPIIEKEGLRVEVQSHPYDFCELNDEACDLVKSFRSPNLGYVYSASHGFFYDQGKGDVRHMLKYAGDELTHVLFADTWNQTKDCRYILNPPWLNARGSADVTIHQHTAMGEGEVDFAGIFETLREMDFANKQLKPDAPKVGGDNIACVSYFGFPEKMDVQTPEARERIERLLGFRYLDWVQAFHLRQRILVADDSLALFRYDLGTFTLRRFRLFREHFRRLTLLFYRLLLFHREWTEVHLLLFRLREPGGPGILHDWAGVGKHALERGSEMLAYRMLAFRIANVRRDVGTGIAMSFLETIMQVRHVVRRTGITEILTGAEAPDIGFLQCVHPGPEVADVVGDSEQRHALRLD